MSNPAKTRAIAEAKVKTDKADAQILAQLLAAATYQRYGGRTPWLRGRWGSERSLNRG